MDGKLCKMRTYASKCRFSNPLDLSNFLLSPTFDYRLGLDFQTLKCLPLLKYPTLPNI